MAITLRLLVPAGDGDDDFTGEHYFEPSAGGGPPEDDDAAFRPAGIACLRVRHRLVHFVGADPPPSHLLPGVAAEPHDPNTWSSRSPAVRCCSLTVCV